jgi:hypothetical protein
MFIKVELTNEVPMLLFSLWLMAVKLEYRTSDGTDRRKEIRKEFAAPLA